MRRTVLFLIIGVIYIVLIATGLGMVYTAGEPVPAKEIVKLDNKIVIAHTDVFGPLERPQVIFNHSKHEDAFKKEGCSVCHPVNDKQTLSFSFPKNVKTKAPKAVMNAYHTECIDCHKRRGGEKLKTGPVTCADCHAKKQATVQIKYPVFEFDFSVHDKHVKKLKEKIGKDDCGQCHHAYSVEEKKLIYKEGTEESCYYCHDLTKKRGPELAAVIKVAAEKGLSIRKAAHQQCLNCHIKYQKKGDKETGPTECVKCHTGKYKTIAELEKVSPPNRKQKDVSFINVENAKMKGVTFDHKTHQAYSKSCRSCHHETLKACKECHSLTGKPEGSNINIAKAYHNVFSEHSCAGCHNKKKEDKKCAGCHHFIPAMDVETMSPKQDSCSACHTGKQEKILMPKPLSSAGLDQQKVKKEVEIKVLEKEFEPAKFPHRDIIDKLVKISNDNKMATYFHRNIQTLCDGCHHRSSAAAEAQKETPPYCRNCHMIASDREHLNAVKLLTAYHNQCMGCHDAMKVEKGSSTQFGKDGRCDACHKKKVGAPAEITKARNQNVYEQNKKLILNKWRPD
jgi:predicted CXXCH cytochrome family protein